MQNNDRARQFMPFDSLKGFKEEINKRKKIIVRKKELSEDDLDELQRKINMISIGMLVETTYFDGNDYIKHEGMVSKLDKESRYISIVKTKIKFDNIIEIKIIN